MFVSVQLNEGVMYDVWFNTTDRSYGFINTDASSQGIVPSFDAPKDILDYYGVRMKTYYNVSITVCSFPYNLLTPGTDLER